MNRTRITVTLGLIGAVLAACSPSTHAGAGLAAHNEASQGGAATSEPTATAKSVSFTSFNGDKPAISVIMWIDGKVALGAVHVLSLWASDLGVNSSLRLRVVRADLKAGEFELEVVLPERTSKMTLKTPTLDPGAHEGTLDGLPVRYAVCDLY